MTGLRRLAIAAVLLLALPVGGAAQGPGLGDLLARAQALAEGGATGDALARLRAVRAALDRVVAEHPASDEALAILRREPLPWFDIRDADNRIRALSKARLAARLQAVAASRPTPVTVPVAATAAAASAPPVDRPAPTAQDPTPAQSAAALPGLLPVPPGDTGAAGAEPAETAPAQSAASAPPLPPATAETEAALALDRQAIRDLQARLQVMGYDPNGIDGVIGRGTRGALSAWQASRGIAATGQLNAEQLAALRAQSDVLLVAWLADPANARLHAPPPPIALGPRNMTGTWRFTTTCGRNSRLGSLRITGVLAVAHSGDNRYAGRARQSQGFNGRFSGRLDGRRMTGEINWGLLVGRIQFQGTVADQELVIRGRDSNRCAFYAAKSG